MTQNKKTSHKVKHKACVTRAEEAFKIFSRLICDDCADVSSHLSSYEIFEAGAQWMAEEAAKLFDFQLPGRIRYCAIADRIRALVDEEEK